MTIVTQCKVLATLAMLTIIALCASCDRPPVAADVPTPWATSVDGALSLRLVAPRTSIPADEPFILIAELRNNTDAPINVLRPFGDEFNVLEHAAITGPDGAISYTGPIWDYVVGPGAYVTLGSGEAIQHRMEFHTGQYAGSDTPGRYTIVYPYVVGTHYANSHGFKQSGKPDLWIGEITSKPIAIQKR